MTLPTYIEAMKPQKSCGSLLDQQRARRHAVHHHGGQQQRGDRPAGHAERQHGHEGAGGRRVVGRLRARHAGHRALAELLRVLRDLALDRVGDEASR